MSSLDQPPGHALSVDVEDWYHDGGVPAGAAPTDRVADNTRRLLELLAVGGARATFFFLGEVAARHPELVREAAAAGHEIASHGHHHDHLSRLLRHQFREDVGRSLAVLQDLTGRPVLGY